MCSRRAVHADSLLDVAHGAFDSLLVGPREVERIGVRGVVRPDGGEHLDAVHVQDVREVAVEPARVLRVAGYRVVDDAVADVQHPRVVDVHVALEPTRRHCGRIRRLVYVDSARTELAVLEGVASDGLGVVLELEDVLVRVDSVAEEVDAVQEKHVDVRSRERSARRRRLYVRVLRRVAAPRGLRRRRDEFVEFVRCVRHSHEHQVLDGGVRAVRDDHGRGLGSAAYEVARRIRERGRCRGKRIERVRRGRPVPRRAFRRIDVHDVEVDVRVSHCSHLRFPLLTDER